MLYGMLQEAARVGANQTALEFTRCRWTYAQVAEAARRLAHALDRAGVNQGVRVAVSTNDPAQIAVAFFAAAARGAVVAVAPSNNCTAPHSAATSHLHSADLVLTENQRASKPRITGSVPTLAILGDDSHLDHTPIARLRQSGPVIDGSDDQSESVTSRSQDNIAHEAAGLVRALKLQPHDRVLCTMPLDHRLAITVALVPCVAARATLELWSPNQATGLLDAIKQSRATVLLSDLDTLAAQVAHRRELKAALHGVRLIVAPRNESLASLMEAQACFSGKLVTFYHRAATGVVTMNNHGGAADCAGQPLPGVRILLERIQDAPPCAGGSNRNFGSFMCLRNAPRILLDETRQVCEPGVPGRIVIESPAAASRATFNGRHYTNELGYFDCDGDLHILLAPKHNPMLPARSA